jgi:uncharacterized phiE125 gp8 family phage protein
MTLPVSLEDARTQLKAEPGERDDEITDFILDAAGWVEQYTGHILQAREVTEQFRGFGPVSLRAWPIQATAMPGVAYADDVGNPMALSGARLDVSRRPARVLPSAGAFWPFYRADQLFTVTIRAGYEEVAEIPRNFRRAMLVLIAAYDEDREGGAVFANAETAATRLCRGFKVHRV